MRYKRFALFVFGTSAIVGARFIFSDQPQPEILGEGKVGVPLPFHSLAWLDRHCPALVDATAIIYYWGYLEDEVETPLELTLNPRGNWRDMVITFPDGAVDRLSEEYNLEFAEVSPEVVAILKPEVPSGVLLRSDDFDQALCESTYEVEAWVSVEHDQVVLTVTDP